MMSTKTKPARVKSRSDVFQRTHFLIPSMSQSEYIICWETQLRNMRRQQLKDDDSPRLDLIWKYDSIGFNDLY
jgi:hypothetical protein